MPKQNSPQSSLIEAAPGLVRCPFTILIDKAEKAPFSFDGLRARSFIDKEMREYQPRTERRYLGIGMGDYTIEGYEGRISIERKSMTDWQGTLLGWRHEESAGDWTIDIDRRARFKRELGILSAMDCKAVVIEASFGECLTEAPAWGKRTSLENAKYLHSTYISWQQEFPGVPWIFCDDRRMAEITTFRIIEQFWARHAKERRQQKRKLIEMKA
jgi:hypothetical protein